MNTTEKNAGNMTIDQQTVSVQEILWELADPDPECFNRTFPHLRSLFPDVVTEACLYYLAEKGLTAAGLEMAAWLSLDNRYLTPLFDETSSHPAHCAARVTTVNKRGSRAVPTAVPDLVTATDGGEWTPPSQSSLYWCQFHFWVRPEGI